MTFGIAAKFSSGNRRMRTRFHSIALIALAAEIVAVLLLKLGYSASFAIIAPIAAAATYLASARVLSAVRRIASATNSGMRVVKTWIVDPRRYRFSLKSLFLLVLLVAACSAWFSIQRQRIAAEKSKFFGKWAVVDEQGAPVVLSNGQQIILEFSPNNISIEPSHEPKWIDFISSQGISHGIYRWEGNHLRIREVFGLERPSCFEQDLSELKPTGATGTGSDNTYVVSRSPTPKTD